MTVVLHTCCGPCASACVPRLKADGHEVTMLFANSNIDTREEFDKRLHEAEKLAKVDGVKIAALPYDHDEWLREVAAGYEHEPEKGARCARCFRYNLAKAAAYAQANGVESFTTSLTVSPHKVSPMVFSAAQAIKRSGNLKSNNQTIPTFLPYDFKKKEGFKLSVKRTAELGLYRQDYCGCEFSKGHPRDLTNWRIRHKPETVSTNLDARKGEPGDVFTADFQTAGRGRLDHVWTSARGKDLLMSAVLSVAGMSPDAVATLPLVAGLAVVRAIGGVLKWPNDVLLGGKKVAGILCERLDERVIVGIGVNVGARVWPSDLSFRAISLEEWTQSSGLEPGGWTVSGVRDRILAQLSLQYGAWLRGGFAALHPHIVAIDALKGRMVAVRQTDADADPVRGMCGGIAADGSLDVGGVKVYAGEAHVEIKANCRKAEVK